MAITMPSTVTGADATGFTSPVYTATADTAPNATSKQIALTALTSGTAAGVTYHSATNPFTQTYERPATFASAPVVPASGVLPAVKRNVFTMRTRKGVLVVTGQNPQTSLFETKCNIPAGADVTDPVNIRAALSAHIGLLKQLDNEWGDTLVSGIQ